MKTTAFFSMTLLIWISCNDRAKQITDKGLEINGVIWATRNVHTPGTFTENPEDAGMLYQWNSKVGWSIGDPPISTDSSSWKYPWNGNNSATWESKNNVCPVGWRIPTQRELAPLFNTPSEWTTVNGKSGRRLGWDSTLLFLPAAGTRLPNPNVFHGDIGRYWSSEAVDQSGHGSTALNCIFTSGWTSWSMVDMAYGCCVRCVKE